MSKRVLFVRCLCCLVVLTLISCGSTPTGSSNPAPTYGPTNPVSASPESAVSSPPATHTSTPLQVTGISITMNPANFSTINCGASLNIVFTAQITVASGSGGGTIPITWNIDQSSIAGTASFTPGETSRTVTYVLSNYAVQLNSSSTVSGSLSAGKAGNTLTSSTATPSGRCNLPGPFQVVSITITTNPASIATIPCGTVINVTYTASVMIAPNSNAGTVNLTWNAVYRHPAVSITFAPAQTLGTTSVVLTGKVNHTTLFLQPVSLASSSPNVIQSAGVTPGGAGQCA